MRYHTHLPSDTDARLFIEPADAGEHRYVVLLSCPPETPTPATFAELLTTPGAFAAYLTHDPGVSWPDRAGETLALAALERGGIVKLGFTKLADALACRTRAERARR